MANRTMYIGDTYPPLRFQLSQGQQVLDLRPAVSISLTAEGQSPSNNFNGTCTPLWPFQANPNGLALYNLEYPFVGGETANADTFSLFVTVTWSGGIQTFSTKDKLIVVTKS